MASLLSVGSLLAIPRGRDSQPGIERGESHAIGRGGDGPVQCLRSVE